MRLRRQSRLVKLAAVWWLRQTRSAKRRRQARQIMPKLAAENLLAKIGRNAQKRFKKTRPLGDTFALTQDNLTKSWKHRRVQQLNKKQISHFDLRTFIENLGLKKQNTSCLIASVYVQYPKKLDEYANAKFSNTTVLR